MDKPLADIIDQCLAVNPKDRFANIQEVLDALQRRDTSRARRPLVLLGFVGPLLLLTIMVLFGWRGFERAKQESEDVVTQRALEKNRFAAKAVAGKAAGAIARYFRVVQLASRDDELLQIVAEATAADSSLAPYRAMFLNANENREFIEERSAFRESPDRQRLQRKIEALSDETPDAASWFFVDHTGVQLASYFGSDQVQQTIGQNYSWRTYFHGGPDDLVERTADGVATHYLKPDDAISNTHVSAPFQSKATYKWKVAVSQPVFIDEKFVGVIALTVDIGNFLRFNEGVGTFFASLVDGRTGGSYGMVLQHQMFETWVDTRDRIPDQLLQVRAPLDAFENNMAKFYRDPLWDLTSKQEGKRNSPGVFLAATATVMIDNEDTDDDFIDTGLVVIVQESFAAATLPVDQLGHRLLFEGGLALSFLLIVVMVLWGVVLRVLRDPENDSIRRGRSRTETSRSSHDASTLPAPLNRDRPRSRRSDRPT
jgi:hypothetical protein